MPLKLNSMRFKGFVWPHNPTVYSISFDRNMAVHKIPFGRCHLQSLGMTKRIMKGEGEFVGENAYRQFKSLASVFYEDTPGTLVHPLWDSTTAWFVSLKLEQEPKPDYVKYSFVFWEDGCGYQTELELTRAPVVVEPDPEEEPASQPVVWTSPIVWNLYEAAGASRIPMQTSAMSVTHTVVQGETLWGIAQKYGMTLNALVNLNPQIKNPNLIRAGEKVRLT